MKIYDSHSGSGSMAVAANKHGFDSVSNEIDSEYFSKSVLRVEKAYQQKEIEFSLPNQKKAVQGDFLNE
jgi:DNA modification methylase